MAEESGSQPEETHERIRELAYLLWEAGGRRHGHALEYWLVAEREVLTSLEVRRRGMAQEPEADRVVEPAESEPPKE